MNPPFMKEIFVGLDTAYKLRSRETVKVDRVKTSAYGLETVSF